MEVAGVVLGGIPLILLALDNYRRVIKTFKDYFRYDALLNRLKDYLFIQQEQYKITLGSIGLSDMSLDDIEAHLRARHPHKCDRFMSIIRRMNEIAQTVANKLDVDPINKVSNFELVAHSTTKFMYREFLS